MAIAEQQGCVRWRNVISDFFLIGNGTKQGGVLSPYLFTRYVRDIVANIVQSCTVVLLEMCSQTFLLMLMI